MSTPRRKKEIERVREEGKQAFLAGRHRETNPYPTSSSNRTQWFQGYRWAEENTVEEQ